MSRARGVAPAGALLATGGVAAAAVAPLSSPVPTAIDATLVAHVAGLEAGYLTVVMVLLMSRAPWLEREVGADVLARWHGTGGRVLLSLIALHVAALIEGWATGRAERLTVTLAEVLRLPGILAASAGTAILLAVAAVSIRTARRRVGHEAWHGLHLLTYVALTLSFTHQLSGANFAGHRVTQLVWTLMHCYVLALVARFRVIRPLEDAWRHRLRVAAVVPEADGVTSIIVRGRHLDELSIRAGQFLRWRFLEPGVWRTAHPFSLSAPPRGDYLRITVKAQGGGSRRLQSVRPGTRVFAEGPSGTLTAGRRRQRPLGSVLLIAGGSGITPMRALFESLDIALPATLTLLYRTSRTTDIVFRRELERIAAARAAHVVWMTGPSTDPAMAMTGANLTRLVPDLIDRDVYLCGPPRLSCAVHAVLREAGVPARRCHEELFSF